MRFQPKYKFLNNTRYAIEGLKDIVATESSFKIELVIIFGLMFPLLFVINASLVEKLILFISLMLVLIFEAANSAIERVVDLASPEYHEMAKRAKDAGSAVVFISIATCSVVWIVILSRVYFF